MNVRELAHVMALTEFIMPEPDREVNGGYVGDLLSWVMGRAQAGNAWLLSLIHIYGGTGGKVVHALFTHG